MGRIFKFVLIMPIILLLFALFGMLLWNALIPDIFHGPMLTYWQTLGLLVLARFFFGFGGGKHCGHKRHGHSGKWSWSNNDCGDSGCGERGWGNQDWRTHLQAKFQNMSPEEKERFKAKWAKKWNCGPRGKAPWEWDEKGPDEGERSTTAPS
jgi:hypothetical protein